MRSFRAWITGPLHCPRVAAFVVTMAVFAELVCRSALLYPYDPSRRFNFLQSKDGIAPSARQIAEAVDQIKAKAKAGDWILVGDSVLNGAYTPMAGDPAALLREELRKAGATGEVWDLTLAGEDPAMEAAILERLGALPGVKFLVDVGVKIIARPEKVFYFAQLWNQMEAWDESPVALKNVLHELQEDYYRTYQPSGTYGDNVEELRAESWANAHVALLEADHWFRYHFCAKPWGKFVSAALLEGWNPRGAKYFDVTDAEGVHQEVSDTLEKQKQIGYWWGTQVAETDPRWQATLRLFEALAAKRDATVVSLHTLSLKRVAGFQAEYRKPIEDTYQRLKDAALKTGLTILEPATFIEVTDYADADHFRTSGNRQWVQKAIAAAQSQEK